MVFAEAGDIGELVDSVGVDGGKTVSVILLGLFVEMLRLWFDSVLRTEYSSRVDSYLRCHGLITKPVRNKVRSMEYGAWITAIAGLK